MPVVTETEIDALAHCGNQRCAGYTQVPVRAIHTLAQYTFIEQGGDLPGYERSTTMLRFADVADAQCPHCGEPRIVSEQVRPIYANISGQPQSALLDIGRENDRVRDLETALAKSTAETAQLRATVAEQAIRSERQSEQIAQLLAQLTPAKPKAAAKE